MHPDSSDDASGRRPTVDITYTRRVPEHPGRPSRLTSELTGRIAAMRTSGLTLRQIATQLSAEEVPSATGKTTWSASMVAHVLQVHHQRQQQHDTPAERRQETT